VSRLDPSHETWTSKLINRPLSQIDPYAGMVAESPFASPTTPTGSDAGYARRVANRKSMESTISLPSSNTYDNPMPTGNGPSGYSADGRATSFSGTTSGREVATTLLGRSTSRAASLRHPPSSYTPPAALGSQRSLSGTLARSSSTVRAVALQSMPHIYPALLSRVAEAFKNLTALSELVKDGITYKDSFDGRLAVSVIAEIIKTSDRNLALLLGRALDAQKFFHDVTYDHRLRDNPSEVYQFKERLAAPFINGNAVTDSPSSEHAHLGRAMSGNAPVRPQIAPYMSDTNSVQTDSSMSVSFTSNSASQTPASSVTNLVGPGGASSPDLRTKMASSTSIPTGLGADDDLDADDLPMGVFTLLTDCYSPTCSRDNLCYSINCPRRLEQMKRLNMKPTGLSRKLSSESLHDVKVCLTLCRIILIGHTD
jgi:hypothetical protein